MAEVLKILGQSQPVAATLTTLYTVPVATSASGSTLVVCNQTGGTVRIRISAAVAGAADALKQYLLYDTDLQKRSPLTLTLGFALGATDVVRVQTDTAGVSFTLFGVEVT